MKVMTLDENGTSGSRFVTRGMLPPLSRDYTRIKDVFKRYVYTRNTIA